MDEVREKAPQLRVALYHGPYRGRDFSPALLACYDVVVTTYWVLASEFGAAPQGALYRVRWHRCALLLPQKQKTLSEGSGCIECAPLKAMCEATPATFANLLFCPKAPDDL